MQKQRAQACLPEYMQIDYWDSRLDTSTLTTALAYTGTTSTYMGASRDLLTAGVCNGFDSFTAIKQHDWACAPCKCE